MSTRIAHISDIHFESRDIHAQDALARALAQIQPHLMVASGDFANNPWCVKQARDWLRGLCAQIALNADTNLVVVPGNHDYRIVGNLGFRPVTRGWFVRAFPKWGNRRIVHFPQNGVTFFKIDSNPVMLGFARGHVSRWQLRKLRKEYAALEPHLRDAVARSVKIAVVHHHVVPIPHEGSDYFLVLDNAQSLLQFLAELRINIVLHGHKHRAPLSLLRLGTTSGVDRTILVVAAGTAIAAGTDMDPRGNNFNLLTIEPTGLRFVTQYFYDPRGQHREFRRAPGAAYAAESLTSCYRHQCAQAGYSYAALDWDLVVDADGDGANEFSYQGLRNHTATPLREVLLPRFETMGGHLAEPQLLLPATTPGVKLDVQSPQPRQMRIRVQLPYDPSEKRPIDFAFRSFDLNSYCMDLDELTRRFPKLHTDRDWVDKEIHHPVRVLRCAVRFPEAMRMAGPPRFEVLPEKSDEPHEWLTAAFHTGFRYSESQRAAFLHLESPPVGYRYRISWPLSRAGPLVSNLKAKLEVSALVAWLLSMRNRRWPETPPADAIALDWERSVNRVLDAFLVEITNQLVNQLGAACRPNKNQVDLSIMTLDLPREGQPPTLAVLAGTGMNTLAYRKFQLDVGDGNAGRAYKQGKVRIFDLEKASADPKNQIYLPIPQFARHRILFSIPLLHPEDNHHIYAVVNLGSFDPVTAELLASLDTENNRKWMLELAQSYLLPRLRELHAEYNKKENDGGRN